MCESTDPAGAVWIDKGFVTTSSSDRGKNYSRASTNDWSAYFYYNAIDPTYIGSAVKLRLRLDIKFDENRLFV